MDFTRPCIDTSGNYHAVTDIYDLHDYEQDPEKFAESLSKLSETGIPTDHFAGQQNYGGQPVFISEYGGIRWADSLDTDGWGYGEAPKPPRNLLNVIGSLQIRFWIIQTFLDSVILNCMILSRKSTDCILMNENQNLIRQYSKKSIPEQQKLKNRKSHNTRDGCYGFLLFSLSVCGRRTADFPFK